MLLRPLGNSFAKVVLSAVVALALTVPGHAENLAGTVTNGTSGKPAAGAEITLIKLAQGMEEAGSTKADSKGKFSFKLDDAGGPHLVRATFQGAQYFKMAPPGTSTADLMVYDASKIVGGIHYTVDFLRLETAGDQLRATRTFVMDNQSKPPKTQMSDATFEFYLPDGAQIDSSQALGPGGRSVNVSASQRTEKNLYGISFPIRPGETKMQVAFHLPYSGSAELNPKSKYELQHFVVMVPKSMTFEAKSTSYQTVSNGPGAGQANVQVSTNTKPGQSLAFKLSGNGTLPPETENAGAGATNGEQPNNGGASGEGMSSRPGGGLGPPSDAPDPLQNFRWWILGAFGLVLVGGGVYVTLRNKNVAAGGNSGTVVHTYSTPTPMASVPQSTSSRAVVAAPAVVAPVAVSTSAGALMQAMKEELFQLEIERHQGTVSPEEYQSTKAALDQTLARAIQREARKS